MPRQKYYRHYNKKRRGFFKKLLVGFLGLLAAGALAGVALFLYVVKDLPDPFAIAERKVSESTKLYDRTGKVLLYEVHGEEKRTVVPFAQINQHVKDATIVAEDFDFYRHQGIDFTSIARAFIVDLMRGKLAQGGSTITQQLVKNAFLTPERTLTRKIKEAVLSLKIERAYSKEEIFNFYLNQIPYGSNAYGIEAAAQTFFGKSADALTLNEAATLASLPKAPTYYSPYGQNKDELLARKNALLEKMATVGFVKKEDAEKARSEPLAFAKQKGDIKAPHFVMFIKGILEARYGADVVENGGLRVVTTLDYDLQKTAEELVQKIGAENEKKYKAKNAALVAIDPGTGQLLAMVGSRDYFDTEREGNYNVTTSKNRQPGSSFKPFAYAAFLKKGFTPNTILFDVKTEFSTKPTEPYSPGNYDDRFRGPITAHSALAQSLNVPAVEVLYLAGIPETVKLARDMGITTLTDLSKLGLSLVLGGGEVSPLDMAYAYGVFARDGMKNDRSFVLSVQDARGTVLERWERQQKQVLDQNIARTITSILSSNELRAPVFGERSHLFFEDAQVAAKTGTTQKYRDAWVVGYTPSLSLAVWVGNNDGSPMEKGGAGVAAAGPLFHQFMQVFLVTRPREAFTPPQPIVSEKPLLNGSPVTEKKVLVDKDSGKLATPNTPPQKIQEKRFREIRTVLHYVDKNNPTGDRPQNPEADPQYPLWEGALVAWLRENPSFAVPFEPPPTEYDDIHAPTNTPVIQIIAPRENSFFEDALAVEVVVGSRFPLKEVDFFLDDTLLYSDFNPPFKHTVATQLVPRGSHTLLVRAYDIYDNTSAQTISLIK